MHFSLPRLVVSAAVVFLIAIAGPDAQAQSRNNPQVIGEIEQLWAQAPNLPVPGMKGRKSSSRGAEDWMIIQWAYNISENEGVEYLDELEFRIYVEVLSKRSPQSKDFDDPVVLTGDVTYVNVPVGENMGSMYIPPQTINRFGGRKELERAKPKCNIFVEVWYEGRRIDGKSMYEEDANQKGWQNQIRNVPGQIFRQNQCAFIASDSMLYPPIKIENR